MQKLTNDCYILYIFISGVRSRDVYDVFSSTFINLDDTQYNTDEQPLTSQSNNLDHVDVVSAILKMRDDINSIKVDQRKALLQYEYISNEVKSISININPVHAKVTSLLARAPTTDVQRKLDTILLTLSNAKDSVESLNGNVCGSTDASSFHSQHSRSQPQLQHAGVLRRNDDRRQQQLGPKQPQLMLGQQKSHQHPTDEQQQHKHGHTRHKLYSETVTASAKRACDKYCDSQETHKHPAADTSCADVSSQIFRVSEPIRGTDSDTRPLETHRLHETAVNYQKTNGSGFIAARRKKIVTIHVGNIDPDVSDSDLYDYLISKNVQPTNITMYYGRYGSSARVNIHYTDEDTVLSTDFWPDEITYRKWVNKTEWQNSYTDSGDNSRHQHYQQSYKKRSNRNPRNYDNRSYRAYARDRDDYWYNGSERRQLATQSRSDTGHSNSWGRHDTEDRNEGTESWLHSA